MNTKKIIFRGLKHTLEFIANNIQSEEKKKSLNAQRQKDISIADKNNAEMIKTLLESISEYRLRNLQRYKEEIEFYKSLEYSNDSILNNLMQQKNFDHDILKDLIALRIKSDKGIISNIKSLAMPNRRHAEREKVGSQIKYIKEKRWYSGFLFDISMTGAQIHSNQFLYAGDLTTILLDNYYESKKEKITGRVVWPNNNQLIENEKNQFRKFGIQFDDKLKAPITHFIPQ